MCLSGRTALRAGLARRAAIVTSRVCLSVCLSVSNITPQRYHRVYDTLKACEPNIAWQILLIVLDAEVIARNRKIHCWLFISSIGRDGSETPRTCCSRPRPVVFEVNARPDIFEAKAKDTISGGGEILLAMLFCLCDTKNTKQHTSNEDALSNHRSSPLWLQTDASTDIVMMTTCECHHVKLL